MEKRDEGKRESREGHGRKREYAQPDILSEKVFETTALACAKLAGQTGPCSTNKKNS